MRAGTRRGLLYPALNELELSVTPELWSVEQHGRVVEVLAAFEIVSNDLKPRGSSVGPREVTGEMLKG